MLQFAKASTQYLVTVASFTPPVLGSVSMWITPTALAGDQYILAMESNEFRLNTDNDGYLIVCLSRAANKPTSSVMTLSTDVRYHVVATWDNTGTNILYIDGALDIEENNAYRSINTAPMYIGSTWVVTSLWDGYVDDFRMYNRRLSLAEAKTIYACQGVDGIHDGLIRRYLLNEGAEGAAASGAGSVKDTVSGFHMTPANSPTYQASELKWRRAA